jgi:hypothetical protein
MRLRKVLSTAIVLGLLGAALMVVEASSAAAYGHDGSMDVYQVGISFNCNNRDFCSPGELGGLWWWAEFNHNPATGANTGDTEFAGCSHGEFKGAVRVSTEITDSYIAPGSAGPQTFFASGEETDSFRGHRDTFGITNEDTGTPAVPGHYSTDEIFGFDTPPGVAAQIQVAYKPAH